LATNAKQNCATNRINNLLDGMAADTARRTSVDFREVNAFQR